MAPSSRIHSVIRACLALLTLLLAGSSSACGVLTHNEVFRRARYLYSLTTPGEDNTPAHRHHQLIANILTTPGYQSAEQAGAFFPDWGYGCFSSDVPSEAAHWPPFIIAAVRHLHTKYGPLFVPATSSTHDGNDGLIANTLWPNGTALTRDQQEHKEKLIAFIFAVALHESSDATWHSLKMYNGYIRMVAGLDFAGSYSDAHSVVDTGGDILLANRLDGLPPESEAKSWVSAGWWVPVDDIFEIYNSMGLPVNNLGFRFCLSRGLAAIHAVVSAGGALYGSFAERSPAMLDFFDEYYLGGMDEMAASAVWCWRNLTEWVVVGIDDGSDGWNMCDIFKLIKARDGGKIEPPDPPDPPFDHDGRKYGERDLFAALRETNGEFEALMERYQDNIYQDELPDGAIKIYIQDPESIASAYRRNTASTDTKPDDDKFGVPRPTPSPFPGAFGDPIYLTTGKPFSKFGSYLSIGSHGLAGMAAGKDVRVAQAGSVDLTASAFVETEDQDYVAGGAVYSIDLTEVIRSQRPNEAIQRMNSRYNKDGETDTTCHVRLTGSMATFTPGDDDKLLSTPPVHPNARFGAATTPLRVNGLTYNIVTAPGASVYNDSSPRIGFVSAGYMDVFLGARRVLRLSFAEFPGGEGVGEREFGTAVVAADFDGSGDEELVLGMPFADGQREGCGVQLAEGEVVVVRVSELLRAAEGCGGQIQELDGVVTRVRIPAEEKRGEECAQNTYEWFGRSLVWLKQSRTLGVGAPGRGKVFFFKLDAQTQALEYTFAIAAGTETAKGAGFGGWGLESGVTPAGKEWVVVGVPNDGSNQVGHVRVYSIVNGGEGVLVARVVSYEQERFGKFGMVMKNDEGEAGLWIASPWANGERGAVWWVDIGAVADWGGGWRGIKNGRGQVQAVMGVEGEVREIVVRELLAGPEPKAHFGASIAVADIDGDGRSDLVVGIPFHGVGRRDENARYAGAVAVYVREDHDA
ncbi:hypothetical protein TWF696_008969 [Orbilia brochopaga]|uniref:Phosphatidylinositol-glycan-specific phospholipase D n=1 Tax=Orbilia brochopaga TaxID=3140254 RepID=A0AAV9UFE9_9PEZI